MTFTPVRVLFAMSVAAFTITAVPGLANAAQAPDVVHAVVAPGSQTDPHHGYYVLGVKPGATITQQLVVTNPNDHTVTANVSGVDAWTGDATGVSYGAPGSTPKGTGTWIGLVTPQLQLAAHETRTIPFTVAVPTSAQAGQYLAALSVSVPLPPSQAANGAGGNTGFDVRLQPQRLVAVEVDVAGPRAPHLVVQGVKPVVQANTLRLQFVVANVGNAFATGHGSLTVADTNTRRDFDIKTFVSHTTAKLAMAWTKDVVPGVHQVTLRLQDQSGRVVTWTGPVDVSGSIATSLEHTLAAAKNAKLHHSSGTSMKWLALLVVPVCIAAAVHLHRRRSGSTPVPVPTVGRKLRGSTAVPPRTAEDTEHAPTPKVEARASR
jgi:hypothetical protein